MLPLDRAKRLLEARGFKLDDKVPELSSILQFLALHPKIFSGSLGGKNVDLKTMQSVLREHGVRLDDTDPVLVMLATNDIVLKDHIKDTKPDRSDWIWGAVKLVAIGIPLFFGGLMLGAKDGIGWGFVAAISFGLVVGLVVGIVSAVLFSSKLIEREPVSKGKDSKIQIKTDKWTAEKIGLAARALGLEPKIAAACRHMLLGASYLTSAAMKERVNPIDVGNALHKCEEWNRNK